jgi:hypothetical protein
LLVDICVNNKLFSSLFSFGNFVLKFQSLDEIEVIKKWVKKFIGVKFPELKKAFDDEEQNTWINDNDYYQVLNSAKRISKPLFMDGLIAQKYTNKEFTILSSELDAYKLLKSKPLENIEIKVKVTFIYSTTIKRQILQFKKKRKIKTFNTIFNG